MSINPIESFELEPEQLQEPETRQRFKITDLASLAWTFRRIQAEQEKRAKILNYAYTETTRIRDWQEKETAPIDNTINFFQGLITEYAQEQRANDPKFKQSTPYGDINFKKQQNKWEWQDDKLIAQQFIPETELLKIYDLAAQLEELASGMVRLKLTLEPEKNAIKKFTLKEIMKEIPCPTCGGTGFSKPGTGYDSVCDDCAGTLTLQVFSGEYQVITPDGEILPAVTVKEQAEKLEIKCK